MNSIKLIAACSTALLLAGCSTSSEHTLVMGEAAQQIVTLQTLNPDAPVENGTENKSTLDGQIGENIMNTYRISTGEPQNVQNEIEINIGN